MSWSPSARSMRLYTRQLGLRHGDGWNKVGTVKGEEEREENGQARTYMNIAPLPNRRRVPINHFVSGMPHRFGQEFQPPLDWGVRLDDVVVPDDT